MDATTFAVDMIGIEDAPASAPLAAQEHVALERCEAVIAKGLQTYIEVGRALLEIRDQRLYRATHQTYADYCNERWGMSRQRAYQLIDASQIATDLSTIVDTRSMPESHVRELAKAAPVDRPAVIDRADRLAGDAPRTARHIHQAAAEISAPELPIDYSIVQRRFAAHGIVLYTRDGMFVTRKEGGTGIATPTWSNVTDRLEHLEAKQAQTDAPPPAPAAPTLAELDTSRMPDDLHRAGYYWHSATPPTIAQNNSDWRGDAPTPEGAIATARLHEESKSEPITVFPALNLMECKALIREAKLFVEKGADRFFPTIGQAIRIAARMALEATE